MNLVEKSWKHLLDEEQTYSYLIDDTSEDKKQKAQKSVP